MDSTIRNIINNTAEQTGVTPEQVEDIMMNMFGFIREKIEAIDFSKIETEEDCRRARTNFNIPRILKLYTTPKRIYELKTKIGEIYSPDVQRNRFNNDPEERSAE